MNKMIKRRCYLGRIQSDIDKQIAEAIDWTDIYRNLADDKTVFIKPNLTYPYFKPGVTTTPQMLEALIRCLKERGCKIIVGESDGGYNAFAAKDTFYAYGLYDLGKKYNISVVNLSELPYEFITVSKYGRDFKVEMPKLLIHDIDAFITLPVPKIHALTQISLSYKNQWGCVPNTMRLRYHPIFNEAIFEINKIIKNKFSVIDGTYGLTRTGPMVGDTFALGYFIVSNSIEAADLIIAKLMQVDLKRIRHYYLAYKNKMVPKVEEIELNQDFKQFISDKFYLKRDLWNYLALFAWLHPAINYFFYESVFADMLHKIMYIFREKPIKPIKSRDRPMPNQ